MGTINKSISKKWLYLFAILLGVGLFYTFRATSSGLWVDESIEYFYSKAMSGAVPGGRNTTNMYERIISTYQPPLYNILMYCWLLIFDSEFGFRMTGVLITLVGGIGFFLAVDKLSNKVFARFGTVLYLLTTKVAYYALECGEYNLMLCFMCWTLYFFISSIKENGNKYLIGFFVCACLTIYSQYGAIFVIAILYLVLVIHFLRKKEKIKELIILSSFTAVVAAILIYFFLMPQMNRQGSVSVSHSPFFSNGNILKDFIVSVAVQIGSNFGRICSFLVALFSIITAWGLFQKNRVLNTLMIVVFTSWMLFYFAVACSFYGYNSWNPNSIGTNNIGGRYGLFFIPVWLITLIFGSYVVFCRIREKKTSSSKHRKKLIAILLILITIAYCVFGVHDIVSSPAKDNFREVTAVWYKECAYKENTFVHQRSDAIFQFYLIHNKQYRNEYQKNIETAEAWIQNATEKEMKEHLLQLGYFDKKSFYYVGPKPVYAQSYNAFIKVMKENGYTVEKTFEGDQSALLHVIKS